MKKNIKLENMDSKKWNGLLNNYKHITEKVIF